MADEALDPGPQMAVCALDLLRVLLAHLRLLGIAMPDRVAHVHFTLDIPCGGLLLTESERGSCLALPPLSHRPGICLRRDSWNMTAVTQ